MEHAAYTSGITALEGKGFEKGALKAKNPSGQYRFGGFTDIGAELVQKFQLLL
jgi:hypothetical protein